MGRSGEGFQGTRQTCRAKRCEAATKLQTMFAASFKPNSPRASFPSTQDRLQHATELPSPFVSQAGAAGQQDPTLSLATLLASSRAGGWRCAKTSQGPL